MTWHVEPALLTDYAEGRTGDIVSASIEAHTDTCPQCRALVRPADTPQVWDAIRVGVSAPRPGLLQRLAARVLPQSDALLLAGSPMFRWAWVESIAAAALFAAVASFSAGDRALSALFLLVAPLLPLAAVALAYGPELDPAHEVSVAAPYSQARLFLLRCAAMILATVPITLVAGFLLPAPDWVPTAWLLPAAAMTAIAIAAGTWFETLTGATVLGVGWVVLVLGAELKDQLHVLSGPTTQVLSLVLLLVGIGVIAVRLSGMDAPRGHRAHGEGEAP